MAVSRPSAATTTAALLLAVACQRCAAELGAAAGLAPVSAASAESPDLCAYGDYPIDDVSGPEATEPEAPDGFTPGTDSGLAPEAVQPEQPPVAPGTAPGPPPPDMLAEEGDLRLVRRTDLGNGFIGGALQAFIGGSFGSVCDNQFGPADAAVACRQLGFVGGVNINSFRPVDLEADADVVAPFVLENLNCTGSEESLVDCPAILEGPYSDYVYLYQFAGTTTGTCNALRGTNAFVACGTITGPEDGDIRLAPAEEVVSEDGSTQYGRVEIFSGGGWLEVCDSTAEESIFDYAESLSSAVADVACRQLGFAGGEKTVAGKISDVPAQIRVDEIRVRPLLPVGAVCTSSESNLAECNGGDPNTPPVCGSLLPLSLVCFSNTGQASGMEGDLRLSDGQAGPGYEYGRLDIFLRGVWRSICDASGFTPDAANVACNALGYNGGAALQFRQATANMFPSTVLPSTLPVGLTAVDCAGNETSLLQCSFVDATSDFIRSRNLNQPEEVCLSVATFGTMITTDATVLACGESSGSCPEPAQEEGSVRLRGGFGTPCDPVHTGFVEIFNDGEWGGICDNRPAFRRGDEAIADVVCRQLGFPHGTVVDGKTPFTERPGFRRGDDEAEEEIERFWLPLQQVRCLGPESQVTNCDIGPGFRNNNSGCRHNPTRLTVACRSFAIPEAREADTTPGAGEGDVRLADQMTVENWHIGRLELFSEGSWGQVCSTTAAFTGLDANVACRQIGFVGGAVAPNARNGTYRGARSRFRSFPLPPFASGLSVFPEVALAGGPGCTGSEERLLDCLDGELAPQSNFGACFDRSVNEEGLEGLEGNSGPGLVIACAAEEDAGLGMEGEVRLTTFGDADEDNDPEAGVGILEIFHAGAWGTVCNGDPAAAPDYDVLNEYGNPDFNMYVDVTLTEEAAEVVCRQLGFTGGEFRAIERVPSDVLPVRPSWLADLPCVGTEASLLDCGSLAFGNTSSCGFPQRLLCDDGTAGVARLTPRLVDGEADPGGAWAYGRLEVFDGAAFVPVSDAKSTQEITRRGVQVACRTLGFGAGGQAISGLVSALPLLEGTSRDGAVGDFNCAGDEATLADCPLDDYRYIDDPYVRTVEENAVALVCYNPSGCEVADTAPAQGDIRLVPLQGTANPTQPCDEVHLGGVEFFNAGQWGRLCITGFRTEGSWEVDATIACRQLGFPFGSLMENGDFFDDEGDSDPELPTWASIVYCTGLEDRLEDCEFPEDFGNAGSDVPGRPDLSRACPDSRVFSVICRRFPMEDSQVIRRL